MVAVLLLLLREQTRAYLATNTSLVLDIFVQNFAIYPYLLLNNQHDVAILVHGLSQREKHENSDCRLWYGQFTLGVKVGADSTKAGRCEC